MSKTHICESSDSHALSFILLHISVEYSIQFKDQLELQWPVSIESLSCLYEADKIRSSRSSPVEDFNRTLFLLCGLTRPTRLQSCYLPVKCITWLISVASAVEVGVAHS